MGGRRELKGLRRGAKPPPFLQAVPVFGRSGGESFGLLESIIGILDPIKHLVGVLGLPLGSILTLENMGVGLIVGPLPKGIADKGLFAPKDPVVGLGGEAPIL